MIALLPATFEDLLLQQLADAWLFTIGLQNDRGEYSCLLPENWRTEKRWTNFQVIKDERGCVRATLSFQNDELIGNLERRFIIDFAIFDDLVGAIVFDNKYGRVIFRTLLSVRSEQVANEATFESEHQYMIAINWIQERYPEYENPLAYWNL